MATTLSQIKEQALAISTQPSDSVYEDSYLTILANEVITDICNGWKWQFLERNYLIDGEDQYNLADDIDAGDTEIDIADNDLPTTGQIYIQGEVISYTGNDGDTLTGCTIAYDHDAGELIEYVFSLPFDYGRKPNIKMNQTPYNYVSQQEFDGNAQDKIWTIVKDSNGIGYIRIKSCSENRYMFWYQRKANTLSDDTDETIIPDEYALSVIPRIMAGTMMIERYDDPDGLGTTNLNLGNTQLLKMEKYYGQREESVSKQIFTNYRARKPKHIRVNG